MPIATPIGIPASDFSGPKDAAVVVIAAGVSQKPGEDRLALLKRNVEVFRSVIAGLARTD